MAILSPCHLHVKDRKLHSRLRLRRLLRFHGCRGDILGARQVFSRRELVDDVMHVARNGRTVRKFKTIISIVTARVNENKHDCSQRLRSIRSHLAIEQPVCRIIDPNLWKNFTSSLQLHHDSAFLINLNPLQPDSSNVIVVPEVTIRRLQQNLYRVTV
eukprot:751264-Hanusia_phi.AAC.3